jgi:ankyrin repeat protein
METRDGWKCTLGALLLLATAAAARGQAASPADLRQLLRLSGVEGRLRPMSSETLESAWQGVDPQRADRLRAMFDSEKLLDSVAAAYGRRFDRDEVRALIAFYQTPVGRKLVDAQDGINQDLQEIMETWVRGLTVAVSKAARPLEPAPPRLQDSEPPSPTLPIPEPRAPDRSTSRQVDADLVAAIKARDAGEVARLLRQGADPNTRGDFGSMRGVEALKLAIQVAQPELVRQLVEAGARIDFRDPNNVATPLTLAIGKGQLDTFEVLLALGAKTQPGDLASAAGFGPPAMVRRLLEAGLPVDDAYLGSAPALIMAVANKRLENAEILLQHGADVDALHPPHGKYPDHTALTKAADDGDVEAVKLLLSHGADPRLKNGLGLTPLFYAEINGDAEMLRLLREAAPGVERRVGPRK